MPNNGKKAPVETLPPLAALPEEAGNKTAPEVPAEKRTHTSDKAEIQRELLQQEVNSGDRETTEKILEIDINESGLSQFRRLERLKIVSATLLPKLFSQGIKPEMLKDMSKIGSIAVDETNLNAPEKAALLKLREIAQNPGSALHEDAKPRLEKLIDDAYALYLQSADAKGQLSGEKAPDKDKPNALVEFVHDHPYVSAAIITAAAYGLYRYFFNDDKKAADSKEGTGFFSKLFDHPFMLTAGLLGIGALVGPEKIWDFLSGIYKGLGEKKDAFMAHWTKGEYADAFMSLFEGDDKDKAEHEKAATAVQKATGVEMGADAVQKIANVPYRNFVSAEEQGKTAQAIAAGKVPGLGLQKNAKEILASSEEAEKQQAIRDYFTQNKDAIAKLNLPADATVAQVLAAIENSNKPRAGTETAGGKGEDTVMETGDGQFLGFSWNAWRDIGKNIEEKFPRATIFHEKYFGKNTKTGDVLLHPIDFAADFMAMCENEGRPIIIQSGMIAFWDGIKFVELGSFDVLAEAMLAQAKNPISVDSLMLYGEKVAPFMIVGGLVGSVAGFFKGGIIGSAVGALKGAGKGAVFPIKVVKANYDIATGTYRNVKGLSLKAQRLAGKPVLDAETKFYAELANKYHERAAAMRHSELSTEKVKGWFDGEKIETSRTKYLNKFVESYNRLHPDATLNTNLKNAVYEAEATTALTRFMDAEKAKIALPTATAAEAPQVSETPVAETPSTMESKPEPKMTVAETTPAVEPIPDATIRWIENEGTGNTSVSRYEYKGGKYELPQIKIAEMAEEIGINRAAMGDIAEITNMKVWREANWNKAIEALLEQEVTVARLASVTIEGSRTGPTGAEELVMADGSIVAAEVPKDAGKFAQLGNKFTEYFKKKGISAKWETFASNAKTLKFFSFLEKIAGPAMAVDIIYKMETAEDKQKAVVETMAGLGTFMAGFKATDKMAGKFITGKTPGAMVGKILVNITGGLLASWGLSDSVEGALNSIFDKIPGGHGIAKEIGGIAEAVSTASLIRSGIKFGVGRSLKKAGVEVTEKAIAEAVEKKIGGSLMKKVARMAMRTGFRSILESLGARGIAIAAMVADDATGIGILDDPIAIGMGLWMASDIYDIIKLVSNAKEVENQMAQRTGKQIKYLAFGNQKGHGEFQKEVRAQYGINAEDAVDKLTEVQIFGVLRNIPSITIEMRRVGMPGTEIWNLRNGEANGLKIIDAGGKTICEINDEDAGKIDQAMEKLDKKIEEKDESKTASTTEPPVGHRGGSTIMDA